MDEVILCADAESLMHPEMIGLDGCRLDAVPWLKACSTGEEARVRARAGQGGEVWVISADDMEAINVAAAIKHDDALRTVCLVVADATGSASSRAHAAHVDQMLTLAGFVQRFHAEHQRRQAQNNSAAPMSPTAASYCFGTASSPNSAADPAMTVKMPSVAMPTASIAGAPNMSAAPAATVPAPPAAPMAALAMKPAQPASGKSAFLLPVVSGSGGSGKTTVALYLALLAQAEGYRTLLVDGDLQFGDMRSLLSVQKPITMAEVMQTADPRTMLRGTGELPALIAAPRKLEEAEVYAREMPRMLDALAPHFDLIVVNTGTSWTEYHAPLLERASRTLFLIDQRASSVRAAQHALDVCMRSGIATSSFFFALNRCARNALFTSIDVSCALNGAHVVELKDGGHDVEELCGAGLALDLLSEKNDFRESMEELLGAVLPSRDGDGRKAGRSRVHGRVKDAAARGERRGQRRGKHGKRDRAVPLEVTAREASSLTVR